MRRKCGKREGRMGKRKYVKRMLRVYEREARMVEEKKNVGVSSNEMVMARGERDVYVCPGVSRCVQHGRKGFSAPLAPLLLSPLFVFLVHKCCANILFTTSRNIFYFPILYFPVSNLFTILIVLMYSFSFKHPLVLLSLKNSHRL